MTEKDDNQLLREYVKGDIQAFETLYARHKGGTYRFFLRQTEQHAAEDLMQELWKKVVISATGFAHSSTFKTWLYTLARNLMIDRHRHLSVVDKVLVSEINTDQHETGCKPPEQMHNTTESDALQDASHPKSSSLQPDLAFKEQLQQQTLLKCLQRLPKVQMESFMLKQEGGFTHGEIADIVGGSLEAVKSRVKTAVKNLRDCVTSHLAQEVA